ncbi:hypothetical protein [Micromonospora inyonensis]|uniref:Uncharacterized protein n=1 Tax=Micromonospora inyonensis TaxID=47866 RepID=A0A1C6S9K1_9ACTN|nr:hypothetical protein [Micromonospora inyonensis]SCL26139.1 hypothetical protein GA0074694_4428 [Micromonospora inyonensis]
MTDEPTPEAPALRTRSYRNRPEHCRCDKIRYRTEEQARQAPNLPTEHANLPFRVYRCPGSRSWHVATRGFSPANLRSTARIAAYFLIREDEITVLTLVRRGMLLGIAPVVDPSSPAHQRRMKRARSKMRDLVTLGLAAPGDTPESPYRAVDRAGLARVIEVGLEEYAAERAAGRVADPEQDPSLAAALRHATAPWRRARGSSSTVRPPADPTTGGTR